MRSFVLNKDFNFIQMFRQRTYIWRENNETTLIGFFYRTYLLMIFKRLALFDIKQADFKFLIKLIKFKANVALPLLFRWRLLLLRCDVFILLLSMNEH